MFFVLSKLLSIFVTPSDVAVLALVAAAVAFERGRVQLGRRFLFGATAFFLLFGFGPLGTWLARPLEDRFPPPGIVAPDGIIVLGGGIDPVISLSRKTFALGIPGARLTEAVRLARQFPRARLLYTGGSGNLLTDKIDEATTARRFFVSLGVAPSRIAIETRSRNTYENVLFSKALVRPGQRWLLVTSALHMPRAMGVFRQAGFTLIPCPVGYLTSGRPSDFWSVQGSAGGGLDRTDSAAHEWLGLIAYWLAGKTSALFPGP